MMSNTAGRIALLATLPLLTSGFTISNDEDGSGQSLARAIFTGQGLSVVNWDLSAAPGSYGSFTDGPFGIGTGGILTTGLVSGALSGGNRNVDNGHANDGEYDNFCGPNSENALILYAGVYVDSGYNGVQLEFILATEEDEGGQPDIIGFLAYTNNEYQLALDSSGNRITAQSSLAKDPIAIRFPNSVTGYSRSTPPLIATLPIPGGNTQLDIYLSICDINNAGRDSALLVKGTACTDCELTPNGAEINYVKETTTLERGEQAYTSTIPASGTASGTFIYFVAPEETTTTTLEQPTSTDITTTADESTETTTTDLAIATTTTTSGEVKSTSVEAALTTTTTVEEPTTTAESVSTEEPTTTSQYTDTNTSTELGTTVDGTTTSGDSAISTTTTTTVDEPTASSTDESTSAGEPTTTAESASTEEPTTTSQPTDTNTPTEPDNTAEGTTTSDESSITTTVDKPATSSTDVPIVSTVTTTDAATIVTTDTASTVATDNASRSTAETLGESTTVALTRSTIVTTSKEPTFQSDATTTMSSDSNTASWSSSETLSTSSVFSNQPTTSLASSLSETPLPLSSTEISSIEISSTKSISQETPQTLTTHSEPCTTSASSPISSTYGNGSIDSSSTSVSTPVSTISTRLQGSSSAGSTEPSSIETPVYSVPDNSGKPGQTLVATTITTVTYTIVNPYNPSELTVTEYCTTLSYQPCTRCAHQPIPSVSMTTQVVPCNGCGKHGENEVTITAPCAAATEPSSDDHPYKQPKLPKPQGSHQSESLVQYAKPTSVGNHVVPGFNGTVTTTIRHARPTVYVNGESDAHHYSNPANGAPDQQKDHHGPSNPEVTSKNYGNPSISTSHPTTTPNYHPAAPEVAIASGGRLQMDMFVCMSTLIGLILFL